MEQPPQRQKSDENKFKVFVGGLKNCMDEESLRQRFSKFGEIEKVFIVLDQATKRRRGFAFVIFKDEKSCLKAAQAKSVKINGYQLNVKQSQHSYMMHNQPVPPPEEIKTKEL